MMEAADKEVLARLFSPAIADEIESFLVCRNSGQITLNFKEGHVMNATGMKVLKGRTNNRVDRIAE